MILHTTKHFDYVTDSSGCVYVSYKELIRGILTERYRYTKNVYQPKMKAIRAWKEFFTNDLQGISRIDVDKKSFNNPHGIYKTTFKERVIAKGKVIQVTFYQYSV
jgi:hypothetical protein